MKVLGIETSCDDTGVALVDITEERPTVLRSFVSSQVELHALYGGVVPELASREHLKNLPLLVDALFSETEHTLDDVNLIAVTSSPGLKGCLMVGAHYAEGLAYASGIPLTGVHHIEGHIFAPFLTSENLREYPFLALIVSGGHTEIVLVEDLGKYSVLARTIDDAAGEAFDKSAHLLGFPYPGGRALSEMAELFNPHQAQIKDTLPQVMQGKINFSFSGLKTAISLLIKRAGGADVHVSEELRAELCYLIQDAIVTTLVDKLRIVQKSTGVKQIVLTGGVAANYLLQERLRSFCESEGLTLFIPEARYCTDNGAMIALVGGLYYQTRGKLTPPAVSSRAPLG